MANNTGKKWGGREKGTPNKSTLHIREIMDKIVDFDVVIGKLFELTQGVQVEHQTQNGSVVYAEKPDPAAAKILLEYRFGKPNQTIDMNVIKVGKELEDENYTEG